MMRRERVHCLLGMLALALAVGPAAGCKDKKSEPAGDKVSGGKDVVPKPAKSPAADKAADKKPKRRPVKLVPRKEVAKLLEDWLEAQNQGDFTAYSALFGSEFRGVRRSGKKTVHLDHKGWLKDRKRMFRHKMTVKLSKVEIEVGGNGAEIRFIQEWASGSYRDIGPKVIRVAKTPDGLRIVGEEMLSSVLLVAAADLPLASDLLALVYEGRLLVADETDLDWGSGASKLVVGKVVEQDPECENDPPDYETENERYFQCASLESAFDHYVATRPVAANKLPEALARWQGRAVTLYDADGKACPAKVGGFELRAEWDTTSVEAAAGGSEDEEVATTVLENGEPVLTAELVGNCSRSIFARSDKLPAAPMWTRAPAGEKLTAAVKKELPELSDFEEILSAETGIYGRLKATPEIIELSPSGSGRRFVAALTAGLIDCQEEGFSAAVWEVKGGEAESELELVFEEGAKPFAILAAVDITGDGIPEIVVDDGLLVWNEDEFSHFRPLGFPKEVRGDCFCECE